MTLALDATDRRILAVLQKDGRITNAELSEVAGVSESHFRRIFLGAVGMPPHHYIRNRRLARARKLLAMSDLPISIISDECGFYSQSHLTKCFRATHAVPPAVYRRQMRQARP